jgi:hypothetical protein
MSSHPKGVEPALCRTCRNIVSIAVDYTVGRDVAGSPCPTCGEPVAAWDDLSRGEPRRCPRCDHAVRIEDVISVD